MAAKPTPSPAPPAWLSDPNERGTSPPIIPTASWQSGPPATQREEEPSAAPASEKSQPDERAQETEKQQALFSGVDPRAVDAKQASGRSPLRRPLVVFALIVVLAALTVGGAAWWLYARHFESTDDAFIDGHAVQIAPKVAGYATHLGVTDNQLVEKGDVLVEIDPRDYQVALDQAQAALASANGRLAQAQAQVASSDAQVVAAEADVEAAEATAKNAEQDLSRNSSLAPRGAVSQQTLDSSVANARSTTSQTAAARGRATAAKSQAIYARSQLVTAEAEVKEAEVGVRKAELNLSYTKIIAPITGRITHRTLEQGDYLQPGLPLLAIVDPNVWVTANFKETQLTHMQPGQKVDVEVDAFPGRTLAAHVDSFQRGTGSRFTLLPAENATGNYVKVVQRVPVKIVFDQPPPKDMILGPGMSVEPTVTVR